MDESKKEKQFDNVVRYWKLHRGTHVAYAFKFFLCEFLNLANVVMQVKIETNVPKFVGKGFH